MNNKTFPLTAEQLRKLVATYPTPFYIYDERAIRENARNIKKAFAILPGFFEHFAVKALPNPFILKILKDEGFGADCSSLPELLLSEQAGIRGEAIMFTSNDTPAHEYQEAKQMGAIINLDDYTHIDFLESVAGIPELISCRYNPGPLKEGNAIIGKPEEAKYGFTRDQLFKGYQRLREKGARRFALHTMVASNELNIEYHIETARILFELAVELYQKLGIRLEFVNLGGGAGIPYRLDQQAIDYDALTRGIRRAYDAIIVPAGLDPLGIHLEWGRIITGPYGWLVSTAIHEKHIYRDYIGLDATMADLMRPGMYGAYHHITVAGKESAPLTETYDVVGSLCENNDKFAVQRKLPRIERGDLVIIHDAGAHGRAMGFNYNGKLRAGELLLRSDGSVVPIRRRETVEDYFATLDFTALSQFSSAEPS
ncbi:diaminopimelate decarboxylase [Gracilinema caldarium]|uniref:Diaminopimelate decarboxylase n=1 Tax=Gracilinema caldarium (strain ATCC 51460 / DSM 7334 / H1) TaxID=744872 RepID=F8F2I6_GRAC1|nr:diaminopimelate decarboxylase [Gracilinema caldarium]AEJ19101.1 Diaminopimelate decarboxylase [Gracilinema caldarium DSM 7334]